MRKSHDCYRFRLWLVRFGFLTRSQIQDLAKVVGVSGLPGLLVALKGFRI